MNLNGCLVKFSPNLIETRSGRRRPIVRFDHLAQEALLPEGSVPYEHLAVRLLAPSLASVPFNKKHVNAFDENHAGTFGQEVQLSIKGRSWARLYKGLDFERLVIELTANGIRGERADQEPPPRHGVPSFGMSHFVHGRPR